MIQMGTVERAAVGPALDGWGMLDFNSSLIGNVTRGIITGSRFETNYLLSYLS